MIKPSAMADLLSQTQKLVRLTGNFGSAPDLPGPAGPGLFSCFELGVNKNKLASQSYVGLWRGNRVNTSLYLFPFRLHSDRIWSGFGRPEMLQVARQLNVGCAAVGVSLNTNRT